MTTPDQQQDDKAARIMEAAEQVFTQRGYNGARMADIARQAGIGKGTLYQYFSGKREIFFTLFQAFFRQVLDAAAQGSGGDGERLAGAAGLRTFLSGCLRFLDRAEKINPLFLEFWSAAQVHEERHLFLEKFQGVYERFRGTLSDIITAGIESGEFRRDLKVHRLATAFLAVFDGLMVQGRFEPRLDLKGAAQTCFDCLIRGMRPD